MHGWGPDDAASREGPSRSQPGTHPRLGGQKTSDTGILRVLLSLTTGGASHSPAREIPALEQLEGEHILTRWVSSIREQHREVSVLCGPLEKEKVDQWKLAAGLDDVEVRVGNLHECATEQSGASLVVIQANHVPVPAMDLERVVQHAKILNKPFICCFQELPQGQGIFAHLSESETYILVNDGSSCCRVTALAPASAHGVERPRSHEQASQGKWVSLVPIYVIRQSWLFQNPAHGRVTDAFSQNLIQDALSNSEVYALRVWCSLPVTGALSAQFAEAFLQFYSKHDEDSKRRPGKASQALAVKEDIMEVLKDFASLCEEGGLLKASRGKGSELPACFQGGLEGQRKKQHPLFITSNFSYGQHTRETSHCPSSWHGIRWEKTVTKNRLAS